MSNTKILALFFAIMASSVVPVVDASGPVATIQSTLPRPQRHLESVPSPGPTPPSPQPSFSRVSVKETHFRQEFLVGVAREFDDDDVSMLEMLYQGYTVEYSPDSEASSRITTTCIINRQSIFTVDPDLVDETEDHLLLVDYTMRFESSYYNVTTYPELFQNWTNSNLDTLLVQMQSLTLDVTTLDKSKRIIISTPAPSTVSTTVPMNSPTPSFRPTPMPSTSLAPSDGASSTTTVELKRKTGFNVARASLYIAVSLIIIAAVSFFIIIAGRKDRTNICDSKDASTTNDPECGRRSQTDDDSTNTPTTSDPKRGESRADNVEIIDFEDGSTKGVYSDVSFGKMETIPIK